MHGARVFLASLLLVGLCAFALGQSTTVQPTTAQPTTAAPTTAAPTTAAPTTAAPTTAAPTTAAPTAAPTTAAASGVPTGWASWLVPNGNNVNQSVYLNNGVRLDVAVFGGNTLDAQWGAGVGNAITNVTYVSGFAQTILTFTINATDTTASANPLMTPADLSTYITLSGGDVDQNSFLFVRVNGVWTNALSTCPQATAYRSYSRYLLTTKVCALGAFAVMRTDSTNKSLCVVQGTDKLIVGSYPVLDILNTKFVNNTLFTNVVGPYVAGRTYSSITLNNANSTTCTSGGASPNVWSTSFSQCRDILSLALPWYNHTVCGFSTIYSDDYQLQFKGTINLAYVDSIGTFSGVPVTRTTQHNYDIIITFQKQIIVTFYGLNVTSDVGIDVALTAEKYTAATGLLTVELTTAVVWSYRIDNSTTVLTPATGVVQSGNLGFDMSGCTLTAGSLCIQKISFQLAISAVNNTCTFDGQYQISTNLLACRDPTMTGCSSTPATFVFSLYSGPVCTTFTVTPKISGSLTAYASSALSTPINSFKLGDQVFFQVNINAGTGNTVNVNFNNIAFDNGDGNGFRYILQNYAQNSAYSAVALSLNPSSYYFSLYLTGSVFRIPYETTATYTFNVTVDLLFAGNKRTVEASFDVKPSVNTLARVYLSPADEDLIWDAEDEDVEYEPETGVADEAASLPVVVGAVVGVVAFNVLVSMLVIAFYKKMTAQNRYTEVSTTA